MEKLKTFLNQYFWLIFMIWLAIVFVIIFALQSSYENALFNKTISNQTKEANKAVQEANNANTNAANSDIERRTEDVIREKTIAPKLEKVRRNSNNSKIEVEKAKKKLNETNKTLHNSNVSRADNCAELGQLFPNETFAYCQ